MTATESPLEQARRVLRLMPRWHRWAAATLQASHLGQELSLRQLGVLYLIREGMTSPGQLSRRLWVTPAVVTGLIDRLEQRGFVRREADPADRRRLLLVLTDTGLATSEAVGQVLADELATQLATYSPDQLSDIDRALDVLEDALAALAARMPAAGDLCAEDAEPPTGDLVDISSLDEPPRPRSATAKRSPRLETIVGVNPRHTATGRRLTPRLTRRPMVGVAG
jgi:DNA-binding MarR family transcriptional regulator